jgi:hypothetical protein
MIIRKYHLIEGEREMNNRSKFETKQLRTHCLKKGTKEEHNAVVVVLNLPMFPSHLLLVLPVA